jgi:hypothetical protein
MLIDRAILLTLLNRGWSVLAGPVTLLLIVKNLSSSEQGYYFTIASILGLQVLFELGLGFVVQQTVSHTISGTPIIKGLPTGESVALSKLGQFLRDLLCWYVAIALIFVSLMFFGGTWFLENQSISSDVEWKAAWLIAVIFFGGSIITNGLFSFSEGLGFIADVAYARLVQNIFSILALWICLEANLHLMSIGLMYCVSFIVGAVWLYTRQGAILHALIKKALRMHRIDWRKEIWPFQWRIALSWTAGYLGSQAIVPIVFSNFGPVAAGKLGLALTLMAGISGASMAWINTKTPLFGQLVAKQSYRNLAEVFSGAYKATRLVALFLICVMLIGLSLLPIFWPKLQERLPSLAAMFALGVATFFNIQVSAQATFLRTFRREPFLKVSVVSGFVLAATVLVFSRIGGLELIIVCYSAVIIFIALCWCWPLFNRCCHEYMEVYQ